MAEKLPQSLRQRLVPLFKEILAYHWVEDLTFNRLSGAVYHVLLFPSTPISAKTRPLTWRSISPGRINSPNS